MKIVGYKLSGQDNDSYMYRDKLFIEKCDTCGYRLYFQQTNPNYVLNRFKDDFSFTYDGQAIVSKAFKDFCEKNEYRGIKFGLFENDPKHFHLVLTKVVKFDAERRKTRFEKLCPQCGNYESIVGAKPAFLRINEPLKDGFFRSDLLFASGNEKHPLTFIGIDTKEKLESSSLRGLEFAPAYGIDA